MCIKLYHLVPHVVISYPFCGLRYITYCFNPYYRDTKEISLQFCPVIIQLKVIRISVMSEKYVLNYAIICVKSIILPRIPPKQYKIFVLSRKWHGNCLWLEYWRYVTFGSRLFNDAITSGEFIQRNWRHYRMVANWELERYWRKWSKPVSRNLPWRTE
jgi:hypothetical protein